MRALPFLACLGSVVAYGSDNLSSARPGESLWAVQVVGECVAYKPTAAEVERFGPANFENTP